MDELVTTDTIINFLKKSVEEKISLPPSVWLDAAMKLTVLLEDEHDHLFAMEQEVALNKVTLMNEMDYTAAKAKSAVEATDIYRSMRKQKARIERIEELVRLSKVQARMRDSGMGMPQ